jgi:hypothetical protein
MTNNDRNFCLNGQLTAMVIYHRTVFAWIFGRQGMQNAAYVCAMPLHCGRNRLTSTCMTHHLCQNNCYGLIAGTLPLLQDFP